MISFDYNSLFRRAARLSGKKQMKPYTQFEDWHLEKLASPSEARAYLQLA